MTDETEVPVQIDSLLVKRWLIAQTYKPPKRGGMPLWQKVRQEFCIGVTYALKTCRRHGIDPDQIVRMR